MTLGFCLQHGANVEIGTDRRCLADGTFAIPPSTACAHRRWINGDWSDCRAPDGAMNGQGKRCDPFPADAWKSMLTQQERAEKKRDGDQQKVAKALVTNRALSGFQTPADGPPKLLSSHAPAKRTTQVPARKPDSRPIKTCANALCQKSFTPQWRAPGQRFCSNLCKLLPPQLCEPCGEMFQPERSTQSFCSRDCQNVSRRVACTGPRVPEVPCAADCGTTILQRKTSAGKLRLYCSNSCRAKVQAKASRQHCLKCGASFTARADSRGYCSVACGGRQTTLLARPCEKCGDVFQPRKATRRFCSNACANSVRRKAVAA